MYSVCVCIWRGKTFACAGSREIVFAGSEQEFLHAIFNALFRDAYKLQVTNWYQASRKSQVTIRSMTFPYSILQFSYNFSFSTLSRIHLSHFYCRKSEAAGIRTLASRTQELLRHRNALVVCDSGASSQLCWQLRFKQWQTGQDAQSERKRGLLCTVPKEEEEEVGVAVEEEEQQQQRVARIPYALCRSRCRSNGVSRGDEWPSSQSARTRGDCSCCPSRQRKTRCVSASGIARKICGDRRISAHGTNARCTARGCCARCWTSSSLERALS